MLGTAKAELEQLTQECVQLNKEEKQKLLTLLQRYEQLFDEIVGTWNTDPVDLTLSDPNCKPYHAKPDPILFLPKEQKLKEEVKRLCEQGILRKDQQI